MNTVDISGVRYLTTKDAAKRVGYTADYVGQLARGGKIDARQIGRAWYVSESEILEHKKGNYRSTKQKTHEALQESSPSSLHAIYNSVQIPESALPEYRKRLLDTSVTYQDDPHPLTPNPDEGMRYRSSQDFSASVQNTPSESHGFMSEEYEESDKTEDPEALTSDVDVRESEEDTISIPIRSTFSENTESEPELTSEPEEDVDLEDSEEEQEVRGVEIRKPYQEEVFAPKRAIPSELSYIPAPLPTTRRPMSVALRVSTALVPLSLVLALCGLVSGIFMQRVVVYTQGAKPQSQPAYQTSYKFSQMSALIKAFDKGKEDLMK